MSERAQKASWRLYYEQLPLFLSVMKLCGRAGSQMLMGRRRALNQRAIGKEYIGKTVEVTPQKIELFAQATKDTNPLYSSKSSRDQVAPPMFYGHYAIYSLMKLFGDKELNLDFAGMFHAGQDFEFNRLARPGERVYAKTFVKKIVDRGKGEILVTNTQFLTEGDELLGKGYSSWYVKKPKSLWTDKEPEFREQLYWEPEEAGEAELLDSVTISENQMMQYAKISGDYNLVHISNFFAKLFGEGKKILQGMCTMSLIASGIVNHGLGGDPHRLKRLNIRFLSNVMAGDVLETTYWPIDPNETTWASFWLDKDDKDVSILGLKTRNQHGDVVVSRGVAKVKNSTNEAPSLK